MSKPPKYAMALTGGVVRMVRTDGAEITEEEVDWLRGKISEALKIEALSKSATHQRSQEIMEQAQETLKSGLTRGGIRFEIDPAISELESERKAQNISRAALARAMYTPTTRMTDWVRGSARPQLDNLRLWASMLGWVFMLVPRPLADQARKLIDEWREQRNKEERE